MGSIKANKIDVYYSASTLENLFDEEALELSKTAHVMEDNIGQVLNEPNSLKNTDSSSFLYENFNLVSYMLIGYFLLFFFSYIFAKKLFPFLSPLKKSKLISRKLLYDDYTQLRAFSSKIALIILFFNFFIFILIILLINFINTKTVIVNTDEIIDSNEKLLSTSKILVTSEEKLTYYKHFPNDSLLFKFIKRIKKNNQYLIPEFNRTKIYKIIREGESSSLFVFNNKQVLLYNLFVIAAFKKNPIIFMKPSTYHETTFVYHMSKKLEKNKKKFIRQW